MNSNLAALAGVALLAGAVVSAYSGLRAVDETLRLERLGLRLVSEIEGLQAGLEEAKALEREFLLTGDPALVARLDGLRAKVVRAAEDVGKRTKNAEQRAAMPAVNVAILEQFDAVAETFAQRQKLGAEASRRALSQERIAVAERADRLVEQAYRRQQGIAIQREGAMVENLAFLERGTLVGILLAVVLIGWSIRAGQRQETARQAAEAALQGRSRELRLLIDAVPAMIAYVDTQERYLLHNRAFAEWLGVPSARIDGRTVRETVGEEEYVQAQPYLARVLAGEEVHYERSRRNADGTMRDLAVAYVPHRGPAGAVYGFYALVTDVTALKQLSRAKGEFVSMASHELRTPATAILGALGMVTGGGVGQVPQPAGELVGIAHAACQRLVRLLDDIQDIERIEGGEIAVELRDEELPRLLNQALAAAAGSGARKGVRLEVAGVVPAVSLRTDAGRVGQILDNLLANAIQFSPDGGVVSLGVKSADGRCRVSIRDHGPGVSEEFRPQLFQKFAQARSAARGRTGRFGLGLAISKMLVERLGGAIGYEPATSGGALFWFELPLAGPAAATQAGAA